MKHKICLSIVLSFGLLAVFWGGMLVARDQNTFFIEDIFGAREYLNEFSVTGVAGDQSHAFMFTLAEGDVQKKAYPFGINAVKNLFRAEQAGKGRLEQYKYLDMGIEFDKTFFSDYVLVPQWPSTVRIIAEDTGLPIDGEESMIRGQTYIAKAQGIDLFTTVIQWNPARESNRNCRVFSGVSITEQEIAFGESYWSDTVQWYNYGTGFGVTLLPYLVEQGETAYFLQGTNEQCVGESILFQVKAEDMVPDELDKGMLKGMDELYQRNSYGKVAQLTSIAVDADHRVLGLFGVGETALGVVHTAEDRLLLRIYDLQGTLLAEEIMMETGARAVGEVLVKEVGVGDGDATIFYECFGKETIKHGYIQSGEQITRDLFQWNGQVLRRLAFQNTQGKSLLTMSKGDMVFEMYEGDNEALLFPSSEQSVRKVTLAAAEGKSPLEKGTHLVVSNGLTEEVLYKGLLVTDFAQDRFNAVAEQRLAKDGTFEELSTGGYAVGGGETVGKRTREIAEMAPFEGRKVEVWLK